MPILDNWIKSPLDFIDNFTGSSIKDITNIKEYFKSRLNELKDISAVPSINDTNLDLIEHNSLVRCRCMVQDQFDPEYYLGRFQTNNENTGEKKMRLGMFQDVTNLEIGERIVHESVENVTLERQTLYCVPVPENQNENGSSTQNKRKREEELMDDEACNEMDVEIEKQNGNDSQKRRRSQQQEEESKAANAGPSTEVSSLFDPNFPLPEKNKLPFLVIMYDNEERPKLNEVYEFIGIMSCDPELAAATMGGSKGEQDELIFEGAMTAEEHSVHCPPSSVVPRIHCILAQKLAHTNPLISNSFEHDVGIQFLGNEFETLRENIIQSLAKILFGDEVAAEYILLNAISRVYGRVEPIALGKFSLNVIKCPVTADSMSIPKEVSSFVELITTKSYLLPLTISNLNENKFIPKKDYNANRLTSGMLQLSEGTHVILDETVLQPGQLNANGVQNLTAIGNVIQWQKVDYDFQFHKCEMKTDITMLIFSEGRSLLQCDCVIPFVQQSAIRQSATSVILSMNPELVDKIRIYMELCRMMDFNLTNQMQEIIKNDYVQMREADHKSMNPEAFHLLLVMSRLVAVSFGQKELTMELWEKTKQLEMQRSARFP